MKNNIIYTFKDLNETGINTIPGNSIVCIDAPGHNTELIKLNGVVTADLTIQQLLDNSGLYIPLGSSELMKITEPNTGWRLKGSNPLNFGLPGAMSVDLGISEITSTEIGATGDYSFNSGKENIVSGAGATAEGGSNTASGVGSHAEGYQTIASGNISHAEGVGTTASGDGSHAEGYNTIAQNDNMHAAGRFNIGDSDKTLFEFGIGINASVRKNAFEIYTDGRIHAPEQTIALHDDPRSLVTKEYADSLGGELIKYTGATSRNTGYILNDNTDDDIGADAVNLGVGSSASGNNSFAEGLTTSAAGASSHSEGAGTASNGTYSHAEGINTRAYNTASHAEGYATIALNTGSHAAGKFNIGISTDTIHETGIGADDTNRKNAFEIYTNGRIIAPELTTGLIANNEQSLITKKYLDDTIISSTHTHTNKSIIDSISEIDDGTGNMVLAYNGNAVDHVIAQRDVYDGLDSTDPTVSLSANQGRVLNEKINNISDYLTLQDKNFDGQVGDTTFVITGEVLTEAFVYVEGLKLRSDQYTVTNDGTDTTITLMQSLTSAAWVAVEYLK